jgi:hypothetical protein
MVDGAQRYGTDGDTNRDPGSENVPEKGLTLFGNITVSLGTIAVDHARG